MTYFQIVLYLLLIFSITIPLYWLCTYTKYKSNKNICVKNTDIKLNSQIAIPSCFVSNYIKYRSLYRVVKLLIKENNIDIKKYIIIPSDFYNDTYFLKRTDVYLNKNTDINTTHDLLYYMDKIQEYNDIMNTIVHIAFENKSEHNKVILESLIQQLKLINKGTYGI